MKYFKMVEISEEEYLEATGDYDVLSDYFVQSTINVDGALYISANSDSEEITVSLDSVSEDGGSDLDYEG